MSKILDIANDLTSLESKFSGDTLTGMTFDSGTISNTTLDVDVTMASNHPAVKSALNASGDAPVYACRAWVNFNGTGTVAIRASGNVSSITDNGVGIYALNFATAMPDANYAIVGAAGLGSANQTQYVVEIENNDLGTSAANINVGITSSGQTTGSDASVVTVIIVR